MFPALARESNPAIGLDRCPGALFSLGDLMIQFDAQLYFQVIQIMTGWARSPGADILVDAENRVANARHARGYIQELSRMGFLASIATLEKIAAEFEKEGCKWKDVHRFADECLGRLIDEAGSAEFFALTVRESALFKNPREGWTAGIARFPSIVDDVVEVSRCFALSRYSAAVFHSVQIVEAALIELGTFIGVADPRSGWTAVSKALDVIIQKSHKDRTPFERKNFEFLEQMQGTVLALKNAWRNKISHAHGRLVVMSTEFNAEVAEEIMFATRAFIRRLADGLPPPKPKRKKREPFS
jgi:hypothetical protein